MQALRENSVWSLAGGSAEDAAVELEYIGFSSAKSVQVYKLFIHKKACTSNSSCWIG